MVVGESMKDRQHAHDVTLTSMTATESGTANGNRNRRNAANTNQHGEESNSDQKGGGFHHASSQANPTGTTAAAGFAVASFVASNAPSLMQMRRKGWRVCLSILLIVTLVLNSTRRMDSPLLATRTDGGGSGSPSASAQASAPHAQHQKAGQHAAPSPRPTSPEMQTRSEAEQQQKMAASQAVNASTTARTATTDGRDGSNDGGHDDIQREALKRYKDKVQRAVDASARLDSQCSVDPNAQAAVATLLGPAYECLKKSSLQLQPNSLAYPISDAHAHFNEIRSTMSQWGQHDAFRYHAAAKYAGPWIENHFISHFETMYDDRIGGATASEESSQFCLHEFFGPYVPIFLPWTDHWMHAGRQYPDDLWPTLRTVLRPAVPYIVVVQNAEGLLSRVPKFSMFRIPNVLVLSAGGFGHVPIPLLKQPEDALPNATAASKATQPHTGNVGKRHQTAVYKDPADRMYVASYVGSRMHAPRHMRNRMVTQLSQLNLATPAHDNSLRPFVYHEGPTWRRYMATSCFSLSPRGYGRTSYHLMETLQMGLIPIHVYSDIAWMPYADFLEREQLVLSVPFHDVRKLVAEELLPQNTSWSFDRIRDTERRIRTYRDSHFSFAGAMHHIAAFMLNPSKSDLQCQALPQSIRNAK